MGSYPASDIDFQNIRNRGVTAVVNIMDLEDT